MFNVFSSNPGPKSPDKKPRLVKNWLKKIEPIPADEFFNDLSDLWVKTSQMREIIIIKKKTKKHHKKMRGGATRN